MGRIQDKGPDRRRHDIRALHEAGFLRIHARSSSCIIAGNHKPGLRSVDEAIRRRFNLVPFTVTIPPEERDPEFPEKLKAELPGILAWMIDGCRAWLQQGLAPPQVVTEATAAYLEGEDAISAWIDECCQRDPNSFATLTHLFVSWNAWATKNGEYAGTTKKLVSTLESKGFQPHRKRTGGGLSACAFCRTTNSHDAYDGRSYFRRRCTRASTSIIREPVIPVMLRGWAFV